jgi:hypothetical protein
MSIIFFFSYFFLLSYLAISHLFPFYLPYLPCSTDVTKGDSGREGADGERVQCKEGRGAVSRWRQRCQGEARETGLMAHTHIASEREGILGRAQ